MNFPAFRSFFALLFALFLAFLSDAALALSSGVNIDLTDATITDGTTGTGWTYASGVYTINDGADVAVTGASINQRRIEVAAGATAAVTLTDVTVGALDSGISPLLLNSGAKLTLTIEGTNKLTAGDGAAGIQAPAGTTLTITGNGSIEVKGGGDPVHSSGGGAGIGGNAGAAGGTITINSGTIIANGGLGYQYGGGAGIGGGGATSSNGAGGAGGTIVINGGTVTANGGGDSSGGSGGGAGIGGGGATSSNGAGGAGGTITINGGTVTANGGGTGIESGTNVGGAGIGGGGGMSGGAGGTIAIKGGAVVAVGGTGRNNKSGAKIGSGEGNGGNNGVESLFLITASAGAGGSISPAGSVGYASGSNATVTITPDSGYEISSVMDNSVPVTPAAGGVYTLTNITTDHTIEVTFVAASADLGVTVDADNAAPAPGDTVTFTVIVTNNGPDGAQPPTLDCSIPATITGAKFSVDGLNWSAWPGSGSLGISTLATAGDIATILIEGTISPTAAGGTSISVTCTVSSATPDPDLSDNSATPATLTVTVPTVVTGVSVSPPTASVVQGNTRQFSATVAGTGSPAQTVTWSVSGGGAGTSISTSGLLTVSPNETATTLIVRATSTADTSFSGTATVTVTSSYTPPPPGPTGTYTGQWIQVNGSGVPTENNWGLSILMGFPSDPGYIFVPWFTYDSSGNPSWYVFQGNGKQWSGVDTITMDVVRYHGSPWGTLPYDNSVMGHDTVGTATLTFNSATSATFAYNVEGASRTVNLVPIDGLPMKPSSYTGQWFAPAEDNWGLSVLQGFQSNPDDVFVPWYIYDGSGKASWYVFENHIVGNVVTADVYRYTGPEWGTTWNNGKITNEKVGTAKLTFTSKTAAVFEYDVEGSSRSVDLVKIE